MKISARNMLEGTVSNVQKGQVVTIIKLMLQSGTTISSIITNESADRLGLKSGVKAYAIIKASSVIIGKGMADANISARNIIKGAVQKVKEGMVMAEIVLDIGGGDTITSTISDESVKRMELKAGDEAYAIVKATSVMLGVA
ncbi:MAG: TOBE domain-containing protein [Dissulfurispiraceae bacterium]|jgi:molybdate transport system regulatory protein